MGRPSGETRCSCPSPSSAPGSSDSATMPGCRGAQQSGGGRAVAAERWGSRTHDWESSQGACQHVAAPGSSSRPPRQAAGCWRGSASRVANWSCARTMAPVGRSLPSQLPAATHLLQGVPAAVQRHPALALGAEQVGGCVVALHEGVATCGCLRVRVLHGKRGVGVPAWR